MPYRKDALFASAAMALSLETIAERYAPHGLATIAQIAVSDSSRNTIAGTVSLSVDLRHPDNAQIDEMELEVRTASGAAIRAEHWVVAQRQGQTAAMNLIGGHEEFDAVPFFWSQHCDVPINYVGHAESWDVISVDGSIEGRDRVLRYKRDGRVVAVASIYRDIDSLRAEVEMERAPL